MSAKYISTSAASQQSHNLNDLRTEITDRTNTLAFPLRECGVTEGENLLFIHRYIERLKQLFYDRCALSTTGTAIIFICVVWLVKVPFSIIDGRYSAALTTWFPLKCICNQIRVSVFSEDCLQFVLITRIEMDKSKFASLKNTVVCGRYCILEELNHGSFGFVFLGKDVISNQPVALKMESRTARNPLLRHEYKVSIQSRQLGMPESPRITEKTVHFCHCSRSVAEPHVKALCWKCSTCFPLRYRHQIQCVGDGVFGCLSGVHVRVLQLPILTENRFAVGRSDDCAFGGIASNEHRASGCETREFHGWTRQNVQPNIHHWFWSVNWVYWPLRWWAYIVFEEHPIHRHHQIRLHQCTSRCATIAKRRFGIARICDVVFSEGRIAMAKSESEWRCITPKAAGISSETNHNIGCIVPTCATRIQNISCILPESQIWRETELPVFATVVHVSCQRMLALPYTSYVFV